MFVRSRSQEIAIGQNALCPRTAQTVFLSGECRLEEDSKPRLDHSAVARCSQFRDICGENPASYKEALRLRWRGVKWKVYWETNDAVATIGAMNNQPEQRRALLLLMPHLTRG